MFHGLRDAAAFPARRQRVDRLEVEGDHEVNAVPSRMLRELRDVCRAAIGKVVDDDIGKPGR
jgi:hypothetical protein